VGSGVLAAEAVCRPAVWTHDLDLLRRMARHRRPDVRAVAVSGLVRAGAHAEVLAWLDDPAAPIRTVARDAARSAGIDPREHYRTAVLGDEPPSARSRVWPRSAATPTRPCCVTC
jgi:hypothetical protein